MEASRKGKKSGKKDFQPDPHVDGGNGKKAIVYNTKEKKKGGGEKKTKRIEYSQVIVIGHVRGYFLYRYMRITLSF